MRKLILFLFVSFIFNIATQAQDTVYEVPYRNYFEDEEWHDDYLVVDANQDGDTWFKSRIRIEQIGKYEADDWFFLPCIHLEAGKAYQFCMMARITSIYRPATLEVLLGNSPEPDEMTKVIMKPFEVNTVNSDYYQTCENRCFYVETSGDYFFGVHNLSEEGHSVEVYEIDVENGIVPESPMPVIEPLVQPDPVGHRYATIGIYGPRFNMNRDRIPLDAVIEYEVDGQIVGSSHPEEYVEFQVEVDKNDFHEFRIAPVLNGNPGPKVRVIEYVGQDYPLSPKNFNVEMRPEGFYFTWDYVPDVGLYGFPVIPEEVVYTVGAADEDRCREGYVGWSEEDTNLHQNWLFYPCDYSIWEGTYWFCVAAINEKGYAKCPWVKVVIDPSSIVSIQTISDSSDSQQIYNLSGHKQGAPHPGLNIIQKDGVTKKILITE